MLHLPALITQSVLYTLLLLSWTEQASAETPMASSECLARLDTITALASNETADTTLVELQLQQLENHCSELPQVAHNRGVLAARNDRWPEAIRHFERSLKLDRRASMTHDHLKQIFEYRAAKAYARALNTPVEAEEPSLQLQTSADWNADEHAAGKQNDSLHAISTVEYELYAWWQALQNGIGLREHYVHEFQETAIRLARQRFANRQWQDMLREIAFTAQDAVVVVSDQYHNRTLLLMRLVGNRWKIYQETVL